MRCLIIAAFVAAFILVPTLSRAEDWEQVPSGREPGNQMITPAQRGKVCEAVGMFANIAATLRDQGVTEERQLARMDSGLSISATANHLPPQLVGPLGGVLRSEVAYVYQHREMTPDQVKAHWTDLCEREGDRAFNPSP